MQFRSKLGLRVSRFSWSSLISFCSILFQICHQGRKYKDKNKLFINAILHLKKTNMFYSSNYINICNNKWTNIMMIFKHISSVPLIWWTVWPHHLLNLSWMGCSNKQVLIPPKPQYLHCSSTNEWLVFLLVSAYFNLEKNDAYTHAALTLIYGISDPFYSWYIPSIKMQYD